MVGYSLAQSNILRLALLVAFACFYVDARRLHVVSGKSRDSLGSQKAPISSILDDVRTEVARSSRSLGAREEKTQRALQSKRNQFAQRILQSSRKALSSRSPSKQFPCEGTSSGYRMAPVPSWQWPWFKEMFTPEKGAHLGVGRDVKGKRGKYDSFKVRGVWDINSDLDITRFQAAQQPAFDKEIDRQMKSIEASSSGALDFDTVSKAHDAAVANIRKSVQYLSTTLQKMKWYPKKIKHPTIKELDDTLTYLLHGTSAETLPLIMCNGLRASPDGLMGAASYLADSSSKIDQYVTIRLLSQSERCVLL